MAQTQTQSTSSYLSDAHAVDLYVSVTEQGAIDIHFARHTEEFGEVTRQETILQLSRQEALDLANELLLAQ